MIRKEKIFQELNLKVIGAFLEPYISGYSIDRLKKVLSIIAKHAQENKNYTPLKISDMRRLVPQGDKYLYGLINLGIVIRSGHAIKGQASYKYKFAEDFS